ncbi:MAG: hypothetical protein ACREPM_01930 [Gemmatimonadaceae bacterium]
MQLRVGIVLALLVGIAAPACAQRAVEVGPFAGYYRPLGHFDPTSVWSTALPNTPQDLSGLMLGIDGRAWVTGRLGLELQGALRSGSVGPYPNPGFGTKNTTSYDVQMLTAQVLLRSSANGHRFWVGAGPGVVRHTGNAYSPYGSPTDLAGAGSLGAEADLGRHLALSAGASALVYNFDLRNPPILVSGRMEHGRMTDAAVRVGLMWRNSFFSAA